MANEENILQHNFRNLTAERQREITSMGGKASAKARKEKRDRHKRIQELFAMAVNDPKIKENLARMGIDVTEADLETAADARVMVELLRRGDYKAWQAMKEEAYGPMDKKTAIELTGEINGININVKRYDEDGK